MVSSVNTGVPFPGGALNAPGNEQQSANTFFDFNSTQTISHRFIVHETPYYIKAVGLGDTDFVEVLMCVDTPTGEMQEVLQFAGQEVSLIQGTNALIIDLPGYYRLSVPGGALGHIVVVGGPTSLSYWSFGLQAFTLNKTISAIPSS